LKGGEGIFLIKDTARKPWLKETDKDKNNSKKKYFVSPSPAKYGCVAY
jgi:hypothetical protein